MARNGTDTNPKQPSCSHVGATEQCILTAAARQQSTPIPFDRWRNIEMANPQSLKTLNVDSTTENVLKMA